jgi:hypothetical protein
MKMIAGGANLTFFVPACFSTISDHLVLLSAFTVLKIKSFRAVDKRVGLLAR